MRTTGLVSANCTTEVDAENTTSAMGDNAENTTSAMGDNAENTTSAIGEGEREREGETDR